MQAGSLERIELNYWPAEKEILATVYGAKKFHHYLIVEEFIRRIDSSNLTTFIKRKLVASPKLQRYAWWQYILTQYGFTTEKVPRKEEFFYQVPLHKK